MHRIKLNISNCFSLMQMRLIMAVGAILALSVFMTGVSGARADEDSSEAMDSSSTSDKDTKEDVEETGRPQRKYNPSDATSGIVDPASLDPEPHYKRALQMVKAAEYEAAIKELKTALSLNAQYYDAQYELGVVYQIVGKFDDAKRVYEELVDKRPNLLAAHVSLGSVYSQLKDDQKAEEEFKKAIAIDWYSFQAHYNLANLQASQDKPEAALKEYKICLKLAPDNAMAHNNIGVLFERRGYLEEARDEFLKASHLEPTNKMFLQNLELAKKQIREKATAARKA